MSLMFCSWAAFLELKSRFPGSEREDFETVGTGRRMVGGLTLPLNPVRKKTITEKPAMNHP